MNAEIGLGAVCYMRYPENVIKKVVQNQGIGWGMWLLCPREVRERSCGYQVVRAPT